MNVRSCEFLKFAGSVFENFQISNMDMEWRIKEILNKLIKLQCPIVGNGKDQWLIQVLFKPGSERFDLMYWLLKKLEINDSEISIEGHSLENKVCAMKHILSAIGICYEEETDIIKGSAPQIKQLDFWELLIGLLFNKVALESSKYNFNIAKEYENSVEYVGNICENLNFKHAFDTRLQLFPDYLQKEMNEAVKKHPEYLFSKKLREKYQEKLNNENIHLSIGSDIGDIVFNFDETNAGCIPNETDLTNIEDHISASACNLRNFKSEFENAYQSLKLYLTDVKQEEFVDIGPSFKVAVEKLQSFLRVKNSLNILVSSDSELQAVNSEISTFEIPSGLLSDEKLGEYIQILCDVKEEK